MMENEKLLKIRSLCVTYHGDEEKQALKDVSFSLERGEVLAIVGESGSGKTTLTSAILRLFDYLKNTSVSGEIWFRNRQVFPVAEIDLREYRGKGIGVVFQEPLLALNPLFRVGNQVSETMRYHLQCTRKEARKRTFQLFEELELDPGTFYRYYPHELSGGMRQRVMVAMAFACNPEIVIADEPTSALDPILQKNLMSFMMRKRKEHNTALLLITHDINVAASYSDSLIVLYRGKIVDQGRTEQIIAHPQHWYTEKLLSIRFVHMEQANVYSDNTVAEEWKVI